MRNKRASRRRQRDAGFGQLLLEIRGIEKRVFPFALMRERVEPLQFGIDQAGMTHDQPAVGQPGQEARE